MAMDEQKQSRIIDEYLNADTDPALRSQRPPMRSRAVVPALREQLIQVQTEPKQGEIQQDFIPGSVQKPQSSYIPRPRKLVLVTAYVLSAALFLGLVSFVFFKVFFTVHDVTAFRVGQRKMVSQY